MNFKSLFKQPLFYLKLIKTIILYHKGIVKDLIIISCDKKDEISETIIDNPWIIIVINKGDEYFLYNKKRKKNAVKKINNVEIFTKYSLPMNKIIEHRTIAEMGINNLWEYRKLILFSNFGYFQFLRDCAGIFNYHRKYYFKKHFRINSYAECGSSLLYNCLYELSILPIQHISVSKNGVFNTSSVGAADKSIIPRLNESEIKFRNNVTWDTNMPDHSAISQFDFVFNKVVFLTRDPRDVAISKFESGIPTKSFEADAIGTSNGWAWVNAEILKYSKMRKYKRKILIVRFEDFKSLPHQELKKILDFCKINCSKEEIDKAVKNSDFKNAKRMEQDLIRDDNYDPTHQYKYGLSEKWKLERYHKYSDVFKEIKSIHGDLMQEFGYY